MAGIRFIDGGELQVSNLRLQISDDGTISASAPTFKVRTDMWPHWLSEAIHAAAEARRLAAMISSSVPAPEDAELDRLIIGELRASMRAITSAAFALDAFYASIKVRAAELPHRSSWLTKRISRPAQIFETLRYHLKLRQPGAQEIKRIIREVFRYRDWAVHPGSEFREPYVRDGLGGGAVDWHYVAFRSANAVAVVVNVVSMLDTLVKLLERGDDELKKYKSSARRSMNGVLGEYEEVGLPTRARVEPESGDEPVNGQA